MLYLLSYALAPRTQAGHAYSLERPGSIGKPQSNGRRLGGRRKGEQGRNERRGLSGREAQGTRGSGDGAPSETIGAARRRPLPQSPQDRAGPLRTRPIPQGGEAARDDFEMDGRFRSSSREHPFTPTARSAQHLRRRSPGADFEPRSVSNAACPGARGGGSRGTSRNQRETGARARAALSRRKSSPA